eukprot:m.34816 g.34816  ORF g.34816 m.34816 type:complete len:68 (-) comp9819_c0_seq2:1470-1673(-)
MLHENSNSSMFYYVNLSAVNGSLCPSLCLLLLFHKTHDPFSPFSPSFTSFTFFQFVRLLLPCVCDST